MLAEVGPGGLLGQWISKRGLKGLLLLMLLPLDTFNFVNLFCISQFFFLKQIGMLKTFDYELCLEAP